MIKLQHATYGTVWASEGDLSSDSLMVPVILKTPTVLPYVGSTASLVVGRSALSGSTTRGKSLAEQYLPLAYSIATKMRQQGEDWEEIASLACEVLSRAAANYKLAGKVDAYFHEYARTRITGAILNHRRNQLNDKRKQQMVSDGYELFCQQVKSAEQQMIELEDERELLEAVRSLPEEDSELIHMYFYAGMTQQEMAEHVGISRQAIAKKIKGLCSELRDILATH